MVPSTAFRKVDVETEADGADGVGVLMVGSQLSCHLPDAVLTTWGRINSDAETAWDTAAVRKEAVKELEPGSSCLLSGRAPRGSGRNPCVASGHRIRHKGLRC